jgi:hypothetical protein
MPLDVVRPMAESTDASAASDLLGDVTPDPHAAMREPRPAACGHVDHEAIALLGQDRVRPPRQS